MKEATNFIDDGRDANIEYTEEYWDGAQLDRLDSKLASVIADGHYSWAAVETIHANVYVGFSSKHGPAVSLTL